MQQCNNEDETPLLNMAGSNTHLIAANTSKNNTVHANKNVKMLALEYGEGVTQQWQNADNDIGRAIAFPSL